MIPTFARTCSFAHRAIRFAYLASPAPRPPARRTYAYTGNSVRLFGIRAGASERDVP